METDEILKDLNEQQREAVQFKDGQLIIFAGAGTGKIKVITHRMAYLISQGVEPPAVTFTKKATREMQERVNKLIPAVSNKHKPLIATFHSFCAKFLRTNLIPAGMKPFGIANKSKETKIINQ